MHPRGAVMAEKASQGRCAPTPHHMLESTHCPLLSLLLYIQVCPKILDKQITYIFKTKNKLTLELENNGNQTCIY